MIQSSPSPALSPRLAVGLALASVYFIWGSTYLGIKVAVTSMPPLLMSGGRFVIAGLALLLFLRLRGAALPTREQWINSAKVGILLMAGGNGGVTVAEHLGVDSGIAATVVASMPLWLALFGIVWGLRPRALEWTGMLVGLAGVALLTGEGGFRFGSLASLIAVLAPLCWAFGSAWSRNLRLPQGLMASAAEMLTGGFALLLLSLILGERLEGPITFQSWVAFAYLTVFGSLLAYSAYMYLLSNTRPSLASSYAYVNPVVAVLLGIGLGGETLGLAGVLAMGVILVGVGLIALSRTRMWA